MAIFTLVTIGIVLLLFKSTRLMGIVGLTLILLIYPFLFFMALLIAGCAIFYFVHYRRNINVFTIPKLPFRRR